MRKYPRGSEWRIWDLHLHAPGTKLTDGFGGDAGWDRFCDAVEGSGVAAFGITDYFSLVPTLSLFAGFVSAIPNRTRFSFRT